MSIRSSAFIGRFLSFKYFLTSGTNSLRKLMDAMTRLKSAQPPRASFKHLITWVQSLVQLKALLVKIGPEIGTPCDRFWANHIYIALHPTSCCLILSRLDPSVLSSFKAYSFRFCSFCFMSVIIDFPRLYSFANNVGVVPAFSFLQFFNLSSTDKTVRFHLRTSLLIAIFADL